MQTTGAKPPQSQPTRAPDRPREAGTTEARGRRDGSAPTGRGRFASLLGLGLRRPGMQEGKAAAGDRGALPEAPTQRSSARQEGTAGLELLREVGDPPQGVRRERERPPREAREDLTPFQPPPPALVAPQTPSVPQPVVTGSAEAHAQAAALAERLVTSMRVGRVGRDGHEVRLRLAMRPQAGVEVRLRMVGDQLTAVLAADADCRGEALRMAESLEQELAARGVTLGSVEVE